MLLAEGESCPARPPPRRRRRAGIGGAASWRARRRSAGPGWLERFGQSLGDEFALVRRVRALFAAHEMPAGGGEWPKPDYKLVWPAGLDERDPDIGRSDLPINLSTSWAISTPCAAPRRQSGAELVLASFFWLVKDGMVLDPVRHRAILEYLNQGYAPFRYRDLERLAAFQNRVFAKYARAHKLDFIDVARLTPFDPDLFVDAIHTTYAGERLRAWVFFQAAGADRGEPPEERRLAAQGGAVDRPPPVFAPGRSRSTASALSAGSAPLQWRDLPGIDQRRATGVARPARTQCSCAAALPLRMCRSRITSRPFLMPSLSVARPAVAQQLPSPLFHSGVAAVSLA